MRLYVRFGNAAFEDGNKYQELARILRYAAERLQEGHTEVTLRDINGNPVGAAEMSPELGVNLAKSDAFFLEIETGRRFQSWQRFDRTIGGLIELHRYAELRHSS